MGGFLSFLEIVSPSVIIAAVVVVIIIAVKKHQKHKEEQRRMMIKWQKEREEAERKRAEEEAEEKRKHAEEMKWKAAQEADEAAKTVFKNSKLVQDAVQEMSEMFIKEIRNAKRDVSVVNIEEYLTIGVYTDYFEWVCAHNSKKYYYQSYGLRSLEWKRRHYMEEAIRDMVIPRIYDAMPFDKDIDAKCEYGKGWCHITYTALNGNFSHADW